jgi:hypothetical protein
MPENNREITIIPEPPLPQPPTRRRYGLWMALIVLLLLLVGGAGYYFLLHKDSVPVADSISGRLDQQNPPGVPDPSRHGDTITLGRNDPEQEERKQNFGVDQSLDIIVRSDESIVINDAKIPVAELQRQLNLYRGEMTDQSLDPRRDQLSAWGAYLVRPGDNLWAIHLRLLREYMASRGVKVPPGADRPLAGGYSSDLGKILKFAEHMVGVYNVQTGQMSHNLNLLEPGEKIIVFNLSEIFAQLQDMDLKDLRGVMYDGRVLIFPQKTK